MCVLKGGLRYESAADVFVWIQRPWSSWSRTSQWWQVSSFYLRRETVRERHWSLPLSSPPPPFLRHGELDHHAVFSFVFQASPWNTWRPFYGGYTKKGSSWSLVFVEKFCSRSLTTFQASLGKFGQKSFAPPKICLLLLNLCRLHL